MKMKRTSLVLLLLLTIINDAELKLNIFAQSDISTLKWEASQSLKRLFGLDFTFTNDIFDQEIVINYYPKITVKLSFSCSSTIPCVYKYAQYKMKNGLVVDQKGTDITLSSSGIISIGNHLECDFKTMTASLSYKLKGAVIDGTVKFSVAANKAIIQIIYSNSQKQNYRDSSLTITIEPGIRPNKLYAVNEQAIQNALDTAADCGAIVIGAIILYKFVKCAIGFYTGGPVGLLLAGAT